MEKSIGYAPVDAERGKLYVDSCIGETKNQLRIYNNIETATAKKVQESDRIVKVTIEAAE